MSVKISVIIPVCNAESYLRECLDSLLMQTFKDFEMICVDDGSADTSLGILEEYVTKDSPLLVLRQQNRGAGVARNKGLEVARGEYAIFLDADDFFAPDLLEKLYARAIRAEADIVICNGRAFNTVSGRYRNVTNYLRASLVKGMPVFSRRDIPDHILTVTNPVPWNKLFRRSFLLREQLRFQPLQNCNDLYMVLLSLCVAERISSIDEPLVSYRENSGRNLQSRKRTAPLCFIKALEALYDELHSRGLFEAVEKSFVNMAVRMTAWNMITTRGWDSRNKILWELEKKHFTRMGLFTYSKEDYVERKQYYLAQIMKCALWLRKKLYDGNL
ncbi:MAG: glycosyltransferase family 2 protein [Pyramidobacter sp.]|uniref:glycosyltransferase family 2 protein n=1 Tax=Pyramidobacter sp. TaxID=1943581 RepID=UPI002A802E06|nr:glycosyltransferase family 2 protein [Pyramidobacter sp.]MDY4032193.1 glycosyltransferase family 2 protein [Pyramidobacter sp.]